MNGTNFWRDDDTWITSALSNRIFFKKITYVYETFGCERSFRNFLGSINKSFNFIHVVYKAPTQTSQVLEM